MFSAEQQREEILNYAKILLRITKEDAILEVITDMIIQRILNYCNIRKLPVELNLTAAQMISEAYSDMNKLDILKENNASLIASVSESGGSVSFGIAAQLEAMTIKVDEKVSKKSELNRFRQLYLI